MRFPEINKAYKNAESLVVLSPEMRSHFLNGEYTRFRHADYQLLLTYSMWLLDGYYEGVTLTASAQSGSFLTLPAQYQAFLSASDLDEDDQLMLSYVKAAIKFLSWHCERVSRVAKKYHQYLVEKKQNKLRASLNMLGFEEKYTYHELSLAYEKNIFFLKFYFLDTGLWTFPAFEPNKAEMAESSQRIEVPNEYATQMLQRFSIRAQEFLYATEFLRERYRAHINYRKYLKKIREEGTSDPFHASLILLGLSTDIIGIRPESIKHRLNVYQVFLTDETASSQSQDAVIKKTIIAATTFLHDHPDITQYEHQRAEYIKCLNLGGEIPEIKVAARRRRSSLLSSNNASEVATSLQQVDEAEKFLTTDLDYLVDPHNEAQLLSELLAKVKSNFHLYFEMNEFLSKLMNRAKVTHDKVKKVKILGEEIKHSDEGSFLQYVYKNIDVISDYEANTHDLKENLISFAMEDVTEEENKFLQKWSGGNDAHTKEKSEEIQRLIIDKQEFDAKKQKLQQPIAEYLDFLSEFINIIIIEFSIINKAEICQRTAADIREKLASLILRINTVDQEFLRDFNQCEQAIAIFKEMCSVSFNMSLVEKYAQNTDPIIKGCAESINHVMKSIQKLQSEQSEFDFQMDFIKKYFILSLTETKVQNISRLLTQFQGEQITKIRKLDEFINFLEKLEYDFDIDKEIENAEIFCINLKLWLDNSEKLVQVDSDMLEFLKSIYEKNKGTDINIKLRIERILKINDEAKNSFEILKMVISKKMHALQQMVEHEKKLRTIERKVTENEKQLNKLISATNMTLTMLGPQVETIEGDLNKNSSIEKTLTNVHDCAQTIEHSKKQILHFELAHEVTSNEELTLSSLESESDIPGIKQRCRNAKSLIVKSNVAMQEKELLFGKLIDKKVVLESTVKKCEALWEEDARKNIVNYKNKSIVNYKNILNCFRTNSQRQDSAENFLAVIQIVKGYPPLQRVEILLEYIRREKAYIQRDHKNGTMYYLLSYIGIDWSHGSRLYRLFEQTETQLEILHQQVLDAENRQKLDVAGSSSAAAAANTSLVALPLIFKKFVEESRVLKHKKELLVEPPVETTISFINNPPLKKGGSF